MAIKETLVDTFDLEGRWGLPDWPAEKWLHGKVHFDPTAGISLKAEGLFGEMPKQIPSRPEEHRAVYGATSDSKRVTLLDVTGGLGGLSFGQAGANMSSRYHAMKMVVGEFVPSSTDLKCRSLSIRIHNLEEFFGRHGFEQKFEAGASSVTYHLPQSVSLRLGGVPVAAEFRAGFNGDDFERREIWQQAWFTITPDSEMEFDVLLRQIVPPLHYLVELAVGHRLAFLQIEASSSRTDIEVNGNVLHDSVQIFLSQKKALPLPSREHPLRLLFTLGILGGDAPRYVENFHSAFGDLRDAFDFYFSLDPGSDTDVGLEHHFLSIVNAFESYHRIAGKAQFELPEAEHEARIQQILDSAPLLHRVWLKQKLEYSNEVRLRTRLREIYDEQPDNVKTLLGSKKNFVGAIVDTRNYLTHHSEELKDRILDPLGIWLAVKKLRLVLQVCFLRRMELADEIICRMAERSADYQILHRNSDTVNEAQQK